MVLDSTSLLTELNSKTIPFTYNKGKNFQRKEMKKKLMTKSGTLYKQFLELKSKSHNSVTYCYEGCSSQVVTTWVSNQTWKTIIILGCLFAKIVNLEKFRGDPVASIKFAYTYLSITLSPNGYNIFAIDSSAIIDSTTVYSQSVCGPISSSGSFCIIPSVPGGPR